MTRRKSTCRGRPCPCCGGINPLMISHCLSVVSVGYVFLFIPLSYEKPPGTAPSHPAHAVFPRNNYQTDSEVNHDTSLRKVSGGVHLVSKRKCTLPGWR